MKFLIDSMLPPRVAEALNEAGHDATTPAHLGAHNLPDDVLVEIAAADGRVIVTENASDFAGVTECAILLVRKSWWPDRSLIEGLTSSIQRWAVATPQPGPWAHWLSADQRSRT